MFITPQDVFLFTNSIVELFRQQIKNFRHSLEFMVLITNIYWQHRFGWRHLNIYAETVSITQLVIRISLGLLKFSY